MKVGKLVFLDLVAPPKADEIPFFLDSHRLLNFFAPGNILNLKAASPVISPMQQEDNITLSWTIEPGDILVSMSISCEVKEESPSPESSFSFLRKSDLSASMEPAHSLIDVSIVDGRFSLSNISASTAGPAQFCSLLVPFTILRKDSAADTAKSDDGFESCSFIVVIHVEYLVTRNGCTMNCTTSEQCEISGKEAILVSIEPYDFEISNTDLNLNSLFLQLILKNNFPLSIILYKPETCVTSEDSSMVSDSGVIGCNLSQAVTLHPNEDLYIPIKVTFDSKKFFEAPESPDEDSLRFPRYNFFYSRAYGDSFPIEFERSISISPVRYIDLLREGNDIQQKLFYNVDVSVKRVSPKPLKEIIIHLCYKITASLRDSVSSDIFSSQYMLFSESMECDQWLPVGRSSSYLHPSDVAETVSKSVKSVALLFVYECTFLCLRPGDLKPPEVLVSLMPVDSSSESGDDLRGDELFNKKYHLMPENLIQVSPYHKIDHFTTKDLCFQKYRFSIPK